MCWNERVSWTTLIIGTIFNLFNIFYFRDTTLTLISIGIQWLLLMQLFEALAWRDQNCGKLNALATNGALVANVTQPLMICMLFIAFSTADLKLKLVALGISFAYICYVLYVLNTTGKYSCLRPSTECSHLDLYWWKNLNGLIYCIVLFSVMLLLIRPMKMALFTSGYIGITLGLSILFYSCGAGSMWCWFTSFAPLIIAMYWKYSD